MRVLILGGGGREHALGWKIAQSPRLDELYFAPGNPGTAAIGENVKLNTHEEIVAFCGEKAIELVVVGPEQPLVDGIADKLAESGIACFGPGPGGARLEGSKAFAKEVMNAVGVPTATHRTFGDYSQALNNVRGHSYPLVVKADGLAAGKGVTICNEVAEAERALDEAMRQNRFGAAGSSVVIEEFLVGTEVSFHVISDGERYLPLVTAVDHKALLDGGLGPNTGGMGTFAPNPLITPKLADTIQKTICEPVLRHLREQGHPFRGVLFAGLMLTENGPKVLEYNVRFGDPETQVIMPMLDFDLLPVLFGAATGKLPDESENGTRPGAAVCVVLAAKGYPASAEKGMPISLPENSADGTIFHAGTARDESKGLVTAGGRVLGVTAWGDSLETARANAYNLAEQTKFAGKYFRSDIGGNS